MNPRLTISTYLNMYSERVVHFVANIIRNYSRLLSAHGNYSEENSDTIFQKNKVFPNTDLILGPCYWSSAGEFIFKEDRLPLTDLGSLKTRFRLMQSPNARLEALDPHGTVRHVIVVKNVEIRQLRNTFETFSRYMTRFYKK